jgi:hypothetical protein
MAFSVAITLTVWPRGHYIETGPQFQSEVVMICSPLELAAAPVRRIAYLLRRYAQALLAVLCSGNAKRQRVVKIW